MIFYYSTVTKDFYATQEEAISAENFRLRTNDHKVQALHDILTRYYADIDAVRSKYDEKLSSMIAQIFKDN